MQQQSASRATPQVTPDWNRGTPVKDTVIRASAQTANKPATPEVQPLFEIWNSQGHNWKIYLDCTTEGFEGELRICNYAKPLFDMVLGKMHKCGVDQELMDWAAGVLGRGGVDAYAQAQAEIEPLIRSFRQCVSTEEQVQMVMRVLNINCDAADQGNSTPS